MVRERPVTGQGRRRPWASRRSRTDSSCRPASPTCPKPRPKGTGGRPSGTRTCRGCSASRPATPADAGDVHGRRRGTAPPAHVRSGAPKRRRRTPAPNDHSINPRPLPLPPRASGPSTPLPSLPPAPGPPPSLPPSLPHSLTHSLCRLPLQPPSVPPPTAVAYPPTAISYPPTAVAYPPTAVGYPPTAVGYPPTAVGYPPTAVGYPPTAISYPPTAVGYPPTAVGYPPTAVGYPPTAVGYPPTAVSYPPTAVGYPPTAVAYPPTAVGYPPNGAPPIVPVPQRTTQTGPLRTTTGVRSTDPSPPAAPAPHTHTHAPPPPHLLGPVQRGVLQVHEGALQGVQQVGHGAGQQVVVHADQAHDRVDGGRARLVPLLDGGVPGVVHQERLPALLRLQRALHLHGLPQALGMLSLRTGGGG